METRLLNIEVGKINPSPRNPRKTIGKEELAELAQNIKEQGLLQPITVRPVDYDAINKDGSTTHIEYEIVCGERRYRAVRINAGSDDKVKIACIVKEMTDEEAFDAMITENLQRKDVDPIEEAFAFGELLKTGKTIDEIAERFGKNRRFVQDRCKLNTLIDPLKKLATKGTLPIAGAIMIAKLETELQEKYYAEKSKYTDFENETRNISIYEIKRWIENEFMRLEEADFLEWDEDDEDAPPTEEWNTDFDRCATCCMNTGNAGCLFYSMNEEPCCTDKKCFLNKSAAYMLWVIEKKSDRLAKAGKPIQFGNVVIVDNAQDAEQYGYDFVKAVRKIVIDNLTEKGYMIAKPEQFDGECKYYEDDERIPKLLKQEKVIECLTLGTNWCAEVETRYYYPKGGGDVEEPMQNEARELASKYDSMLRKMNENMDEALRKWLTEKDYGKREEKLNEKEELFFWALLLNECNNDIRTEISKDFCPKSADFIHFAEKLIKGGAVARLQREFIREHCRTHSYNDLSRVAMREVLKLAYPEEFNELSNWFSDKFAKSSEKLKVRLNELGYNIHGEKIQGGES